MRGVPRRGEQARSRDELLLWAIERDGGARTRSCTCLFACDRWYGAIITGRRRVESYGHGSSLGEKGSTDRARCTRGFCSIDSCEKMCARRSCTMDPYHGLFWTWSVLCVSCKSDCPPTRTDDHERDQCSSCSKAVQSDRCAGTSDHLFQRRSFKFVRRISTSTERMPYCHAGLEFESQCIYV